MDPSSHCTLYTEIFKNNIHLRTGGRIRILHSLLRYIPKTYYSEAKHTTLYYRRGFITDVAGLCEFQIIREEYFKFKRLEIVVKKYNNYIQIKECLPGTSKAQNDNVYTRQIKDGLFFLYIYIYTLYKPHAFPVIVATNACVGHTKKR